MRTVSAELAAAIEATVRPLRATGSIDWDGDGHNTDPAPPRVLRDGFDGRTIVAGWGETDTGQPYATSGGTAANYGVSGGYGNMAVTSTGVERTAAIAGVGGATIDVTVYLRPTVVAAVAQIEQKVRVRHNGSSFYETNVQYQVGGVIDLYLVRGVTVLSAIGSVMAYTSGTVVGVRLQASGSTIRHKIWDAAGDQPAAWTATVVDATLPGSAGDSVVLVADRITGNTDSGLVVQWDDLRIVAGNLDNISGQLGDLTITRALTGQLPDEVLVVEGISAATATSNLVKGKVGDERLGAVQFWSRLNPDSPLYGKARANRDAQLGVEFLTSAGWQSVPLMTSAPLRSLPVSVKDRQAKLQLIDARDRFRTLIELPAFVAEEPYDGVTSPSSPGLEAGWPVSYALWCCGRPLSPPARAGCRLWIPMHGSAMPFIGRPFVGGPDIAYTTDATLADRRKIEFDEGPFFLGAALPDDVATPSTYIRGNIADGPPIWSGFNSAGRIEMWAKVPALPSTSDEAFALIVFGDGSGQAVKLTVRHDGTTQLFLNPGGVGSTRSVAGPTYVHDGQWHLFGVHWDDAAGSATFRRDTTSDVVAFTPISAGNTPVAETLYEVTCDVPVAEIQATPDITVGTAWQPVTWDAGVVVDRPQNRRLTGIYPDGPVQAWTLLQQVYGAERGLVWIDVDGVPQLWTAARLNTTDALTPVRTVTSTRDLLSLGYRDDRDMVRNIIRCGHTSVSVLPEAAVWTLTDLIRVEPGGTWTRDVVFEAPVASRLELVASANSAANGLGTTWLVGLGSPVRGTVTATSNTTARITITNFASVPVYLVDVLGPDVEVTAQTIVRQEGVIVEVRDQASIDAYGDSPLDVPANPWSQTPGWALGTAYGLLALLREEQIVYTDIEIPLDPRLEPLDRLQVQDEHGLMLDTEVTLQQRSDAIAGGRGNSTLVARPARNQWLLGGPGVGTPLGETIIGGTP